MPQDAAFPLFHVAGAPWAVEFMQGDKPLLHVGADPHLLRRSQQDTHRAFAHPAEQPCLLGIRFGVVDERDLVGGQALCDEVIPKVLVDAEFPAALRRRQIAEHELGTLAARCSLPDLMHLVGTLHHLAFGIGQGGRVDEPHIQCSLAAVIGDAQHVVHSRIDALSPEPLRPAHQRLHIRLEGAARPAGHRPGLLAPQVRHRQVQHLPRADVGHLAEHAHQVRHVDEAREPRVQAVAAAVGCDLERRDGLAESGGPGVELLQPEGLQRVGLQVALEGVDLCHAVGHRCRGGQDHAPMLAPVEAHRVARLQVQVERPL